MTSISEQAFNDLMDTVKTAAKAYEGPLGATDARERAECYRHATSVLSIAVESILQKGDRLRPAFTRWNHHFRKIMGDNPWTIYDAAYIDPNVTYRMSGTAGTPTYMGICVYGTDEDGDRRIVNNIDDVNIDFADDGSFEVYLSKERPEGATAWVELEPDATDVMVRQYFLDPANQQESTYTIEAVPTPPRPSPLTEELFAERCAEAAKFIEECIMAELTVSAIAATSTPQQLRDGDNMETKEPDVEAIDMAWVSKLMPSPSILYTGNWVNDLGDDEVLVIEGKPPAARYWSVQVLSRWMESIDYRHHSALFTQHNTELEPDGSFRIVLSHEDPGEKNWLETAGLRNLNVAVRAINPENEDDDLEIQFRRDKKQK